MAASSSGGTRDSVLDELSRLRLTEFPPKRIDPPPPSYPRSGAALPPYANTAVYANSVVGHAPSPTPSSQNYLNSSHSSSLQQRAVSPNSGAGLSPTRNLVPYSGSSPSFNNRSNPPSSSSGSGNLEDYPTYSVPQPRSIVGRYMQAVGGSSASGDYGGGIGVDAPSPSLSSVSSVPHYQHLPSRAQPQVPPSNRPPPPPYPRDASNGVSPTSSSAGDRRVSPLYPSTGSPSRQRQEDLNNVGVGLYGAPPLSPTYSTGGASSIYRAPSDIGSNYDSSSIYEPITARAPSQMSGYSSASSGVYNNYSNAGGRNLSSALGGAPSTVGGASTPGGRGSLAMGGVSSASSTLTRATDQNSILGDLDYFGMCFKCGEKVLGEGSGCTAMDHIYHVACFTCHVCDKELRGKPFYAMEGKPYCEVDYLNTLEKCCVCQKPILDRILRATGKPYHPGCFKCIVCGICLDGIPFTIDASNQIYCIDDFHKKFAPRCCVCGQPIMPEQGQEETVRVVALDRSFHVKCYRCEDCGLLLSSEAEGRGCYPLDDHILCRDCNTRRVQDLTAPPCSDFGGSPTTTSGSNMTTEL